jgi:MFS transporter, UMF1 family
MSTVVLNDKKTIKAWAIFDWANSAYSLVISTAIFPVYFIAYTPDMISIGPYSFSNSALYSFAVSFSYIIVACLSPLLSGIADFSGRRKFFLKTFTVIGSLACISLYFFDDKVELWLGTSAFVLATIGFSGSLVFYDSYLPTIVSEDNYNKVSAQGFTYGYIGSVILLIFILAMIQKPDWFGITEASNGSRIGFVLVGFWWLGFAQYTFKFLPKDIGKVFNSSMLSGGYYEIFNAFKAVKESPNLKKFLLAFFFYSAGVQTVIYLATIFAQKELGFETGELIILVLILQLVAIGGAYLFSILGSKKGNRFSILLMITIWIIICILASVTTGKLFFYVLASFVGLVMGGIQSLSRASYAMILQEKGHDKTTFFSFYDVIYKTAIVGGTLLFGLVESYTQNMRYSVLALAVCFIIGFYFMWKTKIEGKSANV